MQIDSQDIENSNSHSVPPPTGVSDLDGQGGGDGPPIEGPHPFDMKSRTFYLVGIKTTICLMTCHCGLEIVGEAHCVDAEAYDASEGKKHSYRDAESQRQEYKGVYENAQ